MNQRIFLRYASAALVMSFAFEAFGSPTGGPPSQPAPSPEGAPQRGGRPHGPPPASPFGPKPTVATKVGDFLIMLPGYARVSSSLVSSFPVDRYGQKSDSGPFLDTKLRLGLKVIRFVPTSRWIFGLTYEHEFVDGTLVGSTDLAGEAVPHGDIEWQRWRRGFLTVAYERWFKLDVGLQTSHWGMGLVANDDDHGATFGSGRFSLPSQSDRNLRAAMTVLPFAKQGGSLRGLALFVAGDRVWKDANADLLDGDEAYQGIAAIKWVHGPRSDLGAYFVRRLQQDDSGRRLTVTVADVAGQGNIAIGSGKLVFGSELASISGMTSRGGTVEHPRQTVSQFGAAATAGYEAETFGGWLDFVYASGDHNLFDGKQNAFRTNSSFDVGMLMFDEGLAAITGHGVAVASNPEAMGYPPNDIEDTASRGSITNALVLSPRLSFRPLSWLETYAREVVAWAQVTPLDPYATSTVGGGLPRNAFGVEAGKFYGMETDLGVRAKFDSGTLHVLTSLEGAMWKPGDAYRLPDGSNLGEIYGVRWNIGARF